MNKSNTNLLNQGFVLGISYQEERIIVVALIYHCLSQKAVRLNSLVFWLCHLCPSLHKIPSGKHTHNYGKSPCLMGKLTISMAMFNSFLYAYQRVQQIKIWLVVSIMAFIFHFIYGMPSFPLTFTPSYFSRWSLFVPATRNCSSYI